MNYVVVFHVVGFHVNLQRRWTSVLVITLQGRVLGFQVLVHGLRGRWIELWMSQMENSSGGEVQEIEANAVGRVVEVDNVEVEMGATLESEVVPNDVVEKEQNLQQGTSPNSLHTH